MNDVKKNQEEITAQVTALLKITFQRKPTLSNLNNANTC